MCFIATIFWKENQKCNCTLKWQVQLGSKSCIEKKNRATALLDGGTNTNKRPPLGRMFDALNKRCKLGDLTNYISNASNLQNVIRSIPAYGSVLGKRQDKAVRQVLSTKTSKRKRERRTSLCIVHKCAVPKLSSSSKLIAYISHISVNPTAVRTVWVTMLFFRNIWPKLT